MGFSQAYVARTAQAKATNPLRERAFNACLLVIKKGPVRLAVACSGRLPPLRKQVGQEDVVLQDAHDIAQLQVAIAA